MSPAYFGGIEAGEPVERVQHRDIGKLRHLWPGPRRRHRGCWYCRRPGGRGVIDERREAAEEFQPMSAGAAFSEVSSTRGAPASASWMSASRSSAPGPSASAGSPSANPLRMATMIAAPMNSPRMAPPSHRPPLRALHGRSGGGEGQCGAGQSKPSPRIESYRSNSGWARLIWVQTPHWT